MTPRHSLPIWPGRRGAALASWYGEPPARVCSPLRDSGGRPRAARLAGWPQPEVAGGRRPPPPEQTTGRSTCHEDKRSQHHHPPPAHPLSRGEEAPPPAAAEARRLDAPPSQQQVDEPWQFDRSGRSIRHARRERGGPVEFPTDRPQFYILNRGRPRRRPSPESADGASCRLAPTWTVLQEKSPTTGIPSAVDRVQGWGK